MFHQSGGWILVFLAWLALPGYGYPGEPAGIDLGKRVKVLATPFKLDHVTGLYSAKATLANRSKPKQTIYGPLSLMVTASNPPGLVLENATGQTTVGQSYVVVQLPTEGLAPGKKIKNVALRFANPGKKLNARYRVYGLLAPNHLPVASAGNDRAVYVGDAVALDGSASTDADGNPLTYRWSLPDKPAASNAGLSATEGLRSGFTVDAPGTYRVQLIVNDGIVDSAPVVEAFSTENSKPVAKAGLNQTAPLGATVTLDGSQSSDVDSDPLTYLWSLAGKPQGSVASLSAPTTIHPSFTLDQPGHYAARLVVNDGKVDSDPATVAFDTVNSKPVANAGPDRADKPVGQAVNLDGSASTDADHDPLGYRWSMLARPAGSTAALIDANAQVCSFVPDLPGDYVAQLIVNDGKQDSEGDTATITATGSVPVNHAPRITSAAPAAATVGQAYSYAVVATDEDGDTLSYVLTASPAGMNIDASTGQIAWTPNEAGVFNATVKAADGRGGEASQDFTITVSAANVPRTTVPVLTGLTRAAAEAALARAQLNLGVPSFRHDATAADGIVLGQSLAADSKANVGTEVALTISLGPDAELPPNPETVAPPVDQTVATTVAESTKFLYTGPNAVQTGVAEGTIEAKRAAVVRGKVLDKANNPLSGVTVVVKDHPEFGQTLSRADGQFDLAVNGGGYLTVDYRKAGFLPVQRQVNAPWQNYVVADDAVLIPLDAKVTKVDLTSSAPMQVARGSVVTDGDGTRQATLMIPQGTKAQVYNADGSVRETTTLNLHLTEYTVGANGPATMPGPLPPTSAYTYAVELKAEEGAVKLNGKDTLFDKPVSFYVDNFLNFPAGTVVPVGYYDGDKKAWIPSDSGRVIKILSIAGGLAEVDGDGDNVADDAAKLAALGMTDAERAKLGGMYPAGKSLWRAQIAHLSTWDYNWPFGPPSDATPPNPPEEPTSDPEPEDPDCAEGSIIQCQNQALGETIPVNGVPFGLHYQSSRVSGRTAASSATIPLSGTSVPGSLKGIKLEISVAGQKTTQAFAAVANQSHTFLWGGLDAYGRKFSGKQTAGIRLGFVYDGIYQATTRFSLAGSGTPITGDRARQEVTLWRDAQVSVGPKTSPDSVTEGWSLGIHHAYDPVGKILSFGYGGQRSTQAVGGQIIETVAGNGGNETSGGGNGNGGPATNISLSITGGMAFDAAGNLYIGDGGSIRRVDPNGIITTIIAASDANTFSPSGIAIGADGGLYIADGENYRILRVGPDGSVTTVAGNGCGGYLSQCVLGDGGPATDASLGSPTDIELGPDGGLYVIDSYNLRVRRVGPDGIITTVAGNGQRGYSGDGGPATAASLVPLDIAISKEGELYILDGFPNEVIRKVDNKGTITSIGRPAGTNGCVDSIKDGQSAMSGCFPLSAGLAIAADNSLYLFEGYNGGTAPYLKGGLRRISPDGIVTTVTGGNRGYGGDNGPARGAGFNYVNDTAIDNNGNIYLADVINDRVRKVRSIMPGLSFEDLIIPSEDGTEIYHFNNAGRHLRTLDAKTKAVRYAFAYDSDGHLTQVTDVSGNITKIERDALGNPTGIVAPFGQRTEFTQDADGHLATVKNPAGETFRMTYTAEGLLTEFKKPVGSASTLNYDDMGRLALDQDALGGNQNLTRTDISNGYEVARATSLNRTTTYRVENLPTGDERRTRIEPDGTQTVKLIKTDGTVQTTTADGTVTTQVQGPDPRFGMLAPLSQSYSVATGGLTFSASRSRTATLSDSTDPLSLALQTDTLTLNGRASTRVYDAATRVTTATSAAGRIGKTTLDAQGRLIKTEITGLQAIDQTYDAQGHLASIAQGAGPDQRALAFAYNEQGWLKSVTDPLNRAVSYEYDLAGRVTRQILPDGRDVLYGYDSNGNLTSLTPPGQPAHIFKYTQRDQTQEYDPPAATDTGTVNTVYEYDLDKALTRITRPDGLTLGFTHDSAGRLAKLTTPDGDTAYAYNATTGKLASITVPDGGKLAYAYSGALPTETAWTGGVAGKVGFAYDNDLRVKSVSVNGADSIAYGYDADSLLTQAGDLALTRDAQNGLLTGTALGKLADTLSYNGFGEVATYEAKIDGGSLFKTDYTRDKLGRITRKVETLGATVNTYDYGYDPAGRLVEAKLNGVVQRTYGYDDNGNRIKLNGADIGSYDAQDRLLTYGGASYAYTANGELKSKTLSGQTTGYVYDVLGNLRKVTLPDGRVIDYLIDGQNRRIGKKVNGSLVQALLWQDQLKPIAELDQDGKVVSRFVYATHVNVPDYLVKGGATYRVVTDHLGSPRFVVNTADGTIAQQMDYDEFGNVIVDSNPGFQPFGFAGGLYDRDTGLVRFGVRDYGARVGRWVSKDPIGFEGGDGNLYRYVLENPLNINDPTGEVAPVGVGVMAILMYFNSMDYANAPGSCDSLYGNDWTDYLGGLISSIGGPVSKATGFGFFGQQAVKQGVKKVGKSVGNSTEDEDLQRNCNCP